MRPWTTILFLCVGCMLDPSGKVADDDLDDSDDPDASIEADIGPDGEDDHLEVDLLQDEAEDARDADSGTSHDTQDAQDAQDDAGESAEDAPLDSLDVGPESGVSCNGPWAGEGRTPTPGTCLETYNVGVYAGETYTIGTCEDGSVNDPVLAVYGDCVCILYLDCGGFVGAGNYCTCTAVRTGTMTICASAFQANEFVRWSYRVAGVCWNAE